MPCFHPNTAWYLPQTRSISWEDRFGKEIPGVETQYNYPVDNAQDVVQNIQDNGLCVLY